MPTAALRPRGSVSSDQTRRASPGSEGILGPPRLVIPGLMSRSYLPSLEKEFALPLFAFNAILGPFHPMNSSFLSSPLCRGIAVIGFGRWHEPPVMGVSQSGEQRFDRMKVSSFASYANLALLPRGYFHDDMHVAVFCEGREVNEVRHGEVPPWMCGGKAPN